MKKSTIAVVAFAAMTILATQFAEAGCGGNCPLARRRQAKTTQTTTYPSGQTKTYATTYRPTYQPSISYTPTSTQHYTYVQPQPSTSYTTHQVTPTYPSYPTKPSQPTVYPSLVQPSSYKTSYPPAPAPMPHAKPQPKVVYQPVVKKQPAKRLPKIHLECSPDSIGECQYTLIDPSGRESSKRLSGGQQHAFDASQPWKIMFRPESGGDWVGYVMKPGHSYTLELNDDGLWGLFEVG